MIVVCSYIALPKAILNTINKKNGVTTQRRALDLLRSDCPAYVLKEESSFSCKSFDQSNASSCLVRSYCCRRRGRSNADASLEKSEIVFLVF